MEFIAKNIDINYEKGPHLCLCVHCDDMDKLVASYPVTYALDPIRQYKVFDGRKYEIESLKQPLYTEINGKQFRVVCTISKYANSFDGEVLDVDRLFWCDPKALHYHSKKEYFPILQYLYEERPSVIMGEIQIKRIVERIL